MMSFERMSTEARGDAGERLPEDSFRLSGAVGESSSGDEARPNRFVLVQRLRQSISAGDYLTPVKIATAVERLYRKLSVE